jgi:ubiquinone/menaquinone biosynthesis C-methylase UbiE
MTFDPKAVRDFEHAGWQQAAAHYTTTFAHATRGFIDDLLDAAGVGTGMRVLDLACGPGHVASAVAERGALPVGLDFSSAMIALARADHPGILFAAGDAEALPFTEDSSDAVVANFGIHHVAEPTRALAEARRVLRPDGRVAFTSWAAPAENIAWRLLFEAISVHGDLKAADTPPPGGTLRSPEDLLRALNAAGFTETEARQVRGAWRVATPGDLVKGFRQRTVRTAALIGAQSTSALPAIEAAIARAGAAYRNPDGLAVPIVAILASGVQG